MTTIVANTLREAIDAIATTDSVVTDSDGDELFSDGEGGVMYSDGANAAYYGPLSDDDAE